MAKASHRNHHHSHVTFSNPNLTSITTIFNHVLNMFPNPFQKSIKEKEGENHKTINRNLDCKQESKSCYSLSDLRAGKQTHQQTLVFGYGFDIFVACEGLCEECD